VLSTVTAAYRPLHLQELGILSGFPGDISGIEDVAKIVKMSGSFLTVRDDNVYIIHQSAKDFLDASHTLFPSGTREVHYAIFSRSLQVMSETLRRDMYDLRAPGFPIDQVKVKQPDPDPLAAVRYSCVYWVDHLHNANSGSYSVYMILLEFFLYWLAFLGLLGGIALNKHPWHQSDLCDCGAIHTFLREKYLYWLEALSLLRSMSDGVLAITKLEGLLQVSHKSVVLCYCLGIVLISV